MVISTDTLSFSDVGVLLSACVEFAASKGLKVAVAVVDPSGGLLGFIIMDGTLAASRDMSIAKAWTAACFQQDTSALFDLNLPSAIGNVYPGHYVSIGGGVAVRQYGQCVGAVGVSGGSTDQDVAVAKCGAGTLIRLGGG